MVESCAVSWDPVLVGPVALGGLTTGTYIMEHCGVELYAGVVVSQEVGTDGKVVTGSELGWSSGIGQWMLYSWNVCSALYASCSRRVLLSSDSGGVKLCDRSGG